MLLHLERACVLMTDHGLDALVATSPENVIYASDYTNWTVDTFRDVDVFVVVTRQGRTALIIPIDGADFLAGRPAAVDAIYTYGTYHIVRDPDAILDNDAMRLVAIREQSSHHSTSGNALKHALTDEGIHDGSIGVDERGLPLARWHALTEILGAKTIVEASQYFRMIRIVKTEDEIARLREVAGRVEAGITAAFRLAVPGATEVDLERAFRTTVAATGTTPGHFETTAGQRSAASFPASAEYRIRSGDIVRADCGGRYLGYWADTGRTIAVGEPAVQLARYYAALETGIAAILALIRPGTAVSDLFTTGVETVRASGIPHYQRHHVGHAIGVEMYEAPILTGTAGDGVHQFATDAERLQAGMVLNIELPYYELGLGGLQIEETLVVRETGYELLTRASHDLRHFASVDAFAPEIR